MSQLLSDLKSGTTLALFKFLWKDSFFKEMLTICLSGNDIRVAVCFRIEGGVSS